MRIDIRFQGQLDDAQALRDHTLRAAHFQLARFGHEVVRVVVRLSDVNGPRGGDDKRCQVLMRGRRVGTLSVEELNRDARAAIDVAMDRLGHTIGRSLERQRAVRRTGTRVFPQPHPLQ